MRTMKWPLLAMLILFSACGGEQQPQDQLNVENASDSILQGDRLKRTRNIFYNIPSPMETAALLQKAGAVYNSKILNDVKKVDTYTTASSQAPPQKNHRGGVNVSNVPFCPVLSRFVPCPGLRGTTFPKRTPSLLHLLKLAPAVVQAAGA